MLVPAQASAAIISGKTETCTIKTSRKVVEAGEPFTIKWKTRNVKDPILVEDIKAGGEMPVGTKGTRKYRENYVYLAHFSLYSSTSGTSAKNPLCTVEVNIVANKKALVQFEPATYGTPNPTLLGSATKVSSFGISVDNGDKVYGSGPDAISVNSNGRWAHTITTALANGSYNVKAYDKDNKEIGAGTFRVATEGVSPTPTPTPAGTDGFSASPLTGKKPLTVSFKGTVNAKKSCGGGNYTLSFGDGASYEVTVPADLCNAQTFTTTHTYAKDGNYMSAFYRGKIADANMINRMLIQVATPEETTSPTNSTSGGSPTDTVPVSPNDVEEGGSNGQATIIQSAAVYAAIQKQLIFLSEQLRLLKGN